MHNSKNGEGFIDRKTQFCASKKGKSDSNKFVVFWDGKTLSHKAQIKNILFESQKYLSKASIGKQIENLSHKHGYWINMEK